MITKLHLTCKTENMYKLFFIRLKGSWFSQDYPADEFLVIYDIDFKYGQNFYMCVTEEAKKNMMDSGAGEKKGISYHIPPKASVKIFYLSRANMLT